MFSLIPKTWSSTILDWFIFVSKVKFSRFSNAPAQSIPRVMYRQYWSSVTEMHVLHNEWDPPILQTRPCSRPRCNMNNPRRGDDFFFPNIYQTWLKGWQCVCGFSRNMYLEHMASQMEVFPLFCLPRVALWKPAPQRLTAPGETCLGGVWSSAQEQGQRGFFFY